MRRLIKVGLRHSTFNNVGKLICGTQQVVPDRQVSAPLSNSNQAHNKPFQAFAIHE